MVAIARPRSIPAGNPLLRAIRRQGRQTKKTANHNQAALTKREARENSIPRLWTAEKEIWAMRFVSVWQGSLGDAHKFIIENGLGPSFGQFVADTQMRGA